MVGTWAKTFFWNGKCVPFRKCLSFFLSFLGWRFVTDPFYHWHFVCVLLSRGSDEKSFLQFPMFYLPFFLQHFLTATKVFIKWRSTLGENAAKNCQNTTNGRQKRCQKWYRSDRKRAFFCKTKGNNGQKQPKMSILTKTKSRTPSKHP